MEKNQILSLLSFHQKCSLQKKNGLIYLNQEDITKNKSYLIKLIMSTIKQIQAYQQKANDELNSFLLENQYQQGENESKKQNEWLIDILDTAQAPITDISEEVKHKNYLSQEILMDLDRQSLDLEDDDYYQDLIRKYQGLIIQLTDEDFTAEFLSPFLLEQYIPTKQLMGSMKINKSYYHINCKQNGCVGYKKSLQGVAQDIFDCEEKQNLQKTKLIIKQITIQVDVYVECNHYDRIYYLMPIEQDYILNVKSTPFIKFEQIFFQFYNIILCQGYRREINIFQDEYIKEVNCNTHLLQYINFIQENNSYLQRLNIKNENSYSDDPIVFQVQKIEQLKYSELFISYQTYYQYIKPQVLINLKYLVYVEEDNPYVREENLRIVRLINKKYTDQLTIILINKFFKEQFSIFRILYDLYQIYE
ncbi:hypothetical protein ABPG74_005484 [Tetrahymena malaccensis]